MKTVKRIILGLLAACVLFWGISMAKCEWLTHAHGAEFTEGWKQIRMIDGIDSLKVLSYRRDRAKVYYISAEHAHGNVVEFRNADGVWTLDSWDTVWSGSGSADGSIWPYFWHNVRYALT